MSNDTVCLVALANVQVQQILTRVVQVVQGKAERDITMRLVPPYIA